MERNKLRYSFFAILFLVLGYIARTGGDTFARQASFILITAGIFFIFSLILKKAAGWVLVMIDLLICGGIHFLRLLQFPEYNKIYDSDIGKFILGGPFDTKIFLYILIGAVGAAAIELCLRQFNKIGMG